MQIKDNCFLITGGSSGLGAACVQRLAGAGGRVIIADLNVEAGEALAQSLGDAVRFVRTDVTSEADVQTAVATAVSQFGALRGIINCAGIAIAARVLGREAVHDLGAFNKVLQVNVVGSFNVIRLGTAVMTENEPNDGGERGIIINTASIAAFDGQMAFPAWHARRQRALEVLAQHNYLTLPQVEALTAAFLATTLRLERQYLNQPAPPSSALGILAQALC